jgi:Ni/Co efflux regulator RcnB
MPSMNRRLALCALAVALSSGAVAAQQTSPPKTAAKIEQKTEPSTWDQTKKTWDQTKEMTRKEWDVAKKKWAQEKVKWNDCNRQSSKEKLEAPKSWSFVASCMTKT